MHVGKSYNLLEFILWTRRNFFWHVLVATVLAVLYVVFDIKWLSIPWTIIILLGSVTAFIVGFENLQTYNRTWEARQIWGAAMGASWLWAMMCRDFIRDDHKRQELIDRHFAWMTAMRYKLRSEKKMGNTPPAIQPRV